MRPSRNSVFASCRTTEPVASKVAKTLFRDGRIDSLADELLTFDDVKQVLGLSEFGVR